MHIDISICTRMVYEETISQNKKMWLSAKTISVFIIFGISFISGLLPCFIVNCLVSKLGISETFHRIISLLRCLSGGVFFATSILVIVPEARQKMDEIKEELGLVSEYPLTELLIGIGFMLLLIAEHSAHVCFDVPAQTMDTHTEVGKFDNVNEHKINPIVSEIHTKTDTVTILNQGAYQVNTDEENGDCLKVQYVEKSNRYDNDGADLYEVVTALDTHVHDSFNSSLIEDQDNSETDSLLGFNEDYVKVDNYNDSNNRRFKRASTFTALQSIAKGKPGRPKNNIRGLILLGALSLHMIFDGLSLGLINEDDKVWNLLLALSLHKSLVFFTIGLQTMELMRDVRWTILVVFCIALLSPIGVAIGDVIISGSHSILQDSLTAILQGLAAGTFIYVTFFEILIRELDCSDNSVFKAFATVFGFTLIAVIRIFDE